ncbi:MAG TPA: BON domain-containing protein [Stellaceae bacterium]|nr:BON domain-containing protein [Stellaceae bacterium]
MPRFSLSAALAAASLAGLLGVSLSLSGCVAVAVGGAAVGGYAIVGEDLSPEQQMRDYRIKAEVQANWGNFNQEMAHRLDATVFDGRVLITGRVPDRRWREEAVRRAHRVSGVHRVYDQMEVGPDTHFIDSAKDTWITTQLRGELIADLDVKSINYSIKTFDRVVYVMGLARNRAELDKVIGHARTVAGVRRVTPFIRVIPEMPDVNGPAAGHENDDALPPEDDGGGPDDVDQGPDNGPQDRQPAGAPRPSSHDSIKAEPLQ